jgi:hypothetical protein
MPRISIKSPSSASETGDLFDDNGHPIVHGNFNNMAFLILYTLSVAFLLHPIGIRFTDSFLFAGLGFAAHLFEDALVFDPAYSFFWPITSRELGIGLFHYSADLWNSG